MHKKVNNKHKKSNSKHKNEQLQANVNSRKHEKEQQGAWRGTTTLYLKEEQEHNVRPKFVLKHPFILLLRFFSV